MPPLTTRDLLGVDLLAAGGPYHGTGSPPGGDFYSADDLKRIARDTNAMSATGELRIPVKLGHSKEQKLLRESGFTDGEMPAAGWVTNVRADGKKLKGDLMRVPGKLADLFDSGAFRTRSVELRAMTSQKDGVKRAAVVSGLAWLGAKAPAVRSLDDVVALYGDQEQEAGVTSVIYEDNDAVWNPSWGYRTIQSALHTALAEDGASFRVVDIGPDRALVRDGEVSWVVPFTVGSDTVELAEKGEWVLGQPDWARTADLVIEMCETGGAADIPHIMDITLSADQATAFAEKLGMDPEGFTVDAAVEKIDSLKALAEAAPAAKVEDGQVVISQEELAELREGAASAKALAEEAHASKRSTLLGVAVDEGKINPGDLDKWAARYNDNPSQITEIISEIQPNDSYAREFGRDSGIVDEERDLADAFDAYLGIEVATAAPEGR